MAIDGGVVHAGGVSMYLYVEEPRSEVVNALVTLLHIPDHQVQSVPGQEALVSGVVDLLSCHVPDAKHYVTLCLQ